LVLDAPASRFFRYGDKKIKVASQKKNIFQSIFLVP
jgi:hypothetical protein